MFVDLPLGNPSGKPWETSLQQSLIREAFHLLENSWQPWTTVQSSFVWQANENDIWRYRYMHVDDSNREALAELWSHRCELQRNNQQKKQEKSRIVIFFYKLFFQIFTFVKNSYSSKKIINEQVWWLFTTSNSFLKVHRVFVKQIFFVILMLQKMNFQPKRIKKYFGKE